MANVIEAVVRLIIGGFILFAGINRLINSLNLNSKNKRKIIHIILSFIIIGVGLYTILESNLAFKTIGLVLIVYSILEITEYIFNKKDTYIEEHIIVETDNSKVIDAVLIEDKKRKLKKKNKKSF